MRCGEARLWISVEQNVRICRRYDIMMTKGYLCDSWQLEFTVLKFENVYEN